MGNFVSVMTDEPAVRRIVGSQDQAKVKEVQAAAPGIAKDADKIALLQRLVDGDFAAGEEDKNGPGFIYLFLDLCQAYAQHKTTEEIYVDEDMFPEIWDFVWIDGGDMPVRLPLSPYGAPAVSYYDSAGVKKYIEILENIDWAERETTADKNYKSEVDGILEVLNAADREGKGVHVFFSE